MLIGGGTPIALSQARMTYNSGIVGDGYGGIGVRYDTGRGFLLRFDARLAVGPGVNIANGDNQAAFEGEFGFGVEIDFNHKGGVASNRTKPVTDTTDSDGDGIPDATDKCPDRPEDIDGFEDQDGCPDIDNDGDHVLDIADKCPNVPETYNGFEDEDGCPDTIPAGRRRHRRHDRRPDLCRRRDRGARLGDPRDREDRRGAEGPSRRTGRARRPHR